MLTRSLTLTERTRSSRTPHYVQALDVLIDAGADVDEANQEMDTPLHLACMHLQPACVRTLLRRNADEVFRNEDLAFPDDVVGHAVAGDERDEEIVEWIYEVHADAASICLARYGRSRDCGASVLLQAACLKSRPSLGPRRRRASTSRADIRGV